MCSIAGGNFFNKHLFEASKDRGRDYTAIAQYKDSWVCNHRATPTTEVEYPLESQPVGRGIKIVHNGVISNDRELGNKDGMIDSSVLPYVLNFKDLKSFKHSLENNIIGSYALAVLFPDGRIWLACNYKPIWIYHDKGKFLFSSLKSHFPKNMKPYKMLPYSVLDTSNFESLEIKRKQYDKALIIASSGLDSTVAISYANKLHKEIELIHFNYGCKATQNEVDRIKQISDHFNCKHVIQKIDYSNMLGNCSLLNKGSEIAKGVDGAEYAHEWVYARNLLMMSYAVAYAEANKIGYIYLGTNLEEGGAYPDNEDQFIKDFDQCLWGAVQNGLKIEIKTPLGNLMKHEIVKLGIELDAPFDLTWSCYHNGEKPCRDCGPCFMRETAFQRNDMIDPLIKECK